MDYTSNRKAFNEAEYFGFGYELTTPGATSGDIQSMIRRQLVGSVAIAIAVAAAAGLGALRPASHEAAGVALHAFAVIQQPAFMTSAERLVSATKQ